MRLSSVMSRAPSATESEPLQRAERSVIPSSWPRSGSKPSMAVDPWRSTQFSPRKREGFNRVDGTTFASDFTRHATQTTGQRSAAKTMELLRAELRASSFATAAVAVADTRTTRQRDPRNRDCPASRRDRARWVLRCDRTKQLT